MSDEQLVEWLRARFGKPEQRRDAWVGVAALFVVPLGPLVMLKIFLERADALDIGFVVVSSIAGFVLWRRTRDLEENRRNLWAAAAEARRRGLHF